MNYRTHKSGAREVFAAAAYSALHPGARVATCGTCGRSWDDGFCSGVTPTPAGRCPFEYQHKPEPRRIKRADIRGRLRGAARDLVNIASSEQPQNYTDELAGIAADLRQFARILA